MNEIAQQNKAAWEEAFDVRVNSFGNDHASRLLKEPFVFLKNPLRDALAGLNLTGASVAQFCCNNGRELMSVVRNYQAREGVGFDIAANILAQARGIAGETRIPCTFVEGDIADIPSSFQDRFDALIVTIGALCWMPDLTAFFRKAAQCLKKNGTLIIHEAHPMTDMLAIPEESAYDPAHPEALVYSYFRREPFVDTCGMGYLAGKTYESKPFICYTHTLGETVTAVAEQGLRILRLTEYDEDLSDNTLALEGKGFPLSYLLMAQKT